VSASSPALTLPAPAGELRRRPGWLAFGEVRLDPRNNGLNLVRLVLAAAVLVAHGWYIAGDGVGPQLAGENMGGWAVFGFFAISGYLITGSRLTKPLGHYIVHRVARIFPAFLVNLVVTAVVFAPVGYWWLHRTLDGFLTTPTTPIAYVISNVTLRINAYDVAGTPGGIPYPGAWNGSLWSLYYEFLCYVVVAVLGSISIFRRSAWAMTGAFAVSVAAHAGMSWLVPYTQGHVDVVYLAKLLPFFLGGGILYMVRERLPLTWPLALAAAATSLALTLWLGSWGPQLSGILIAYVILWVGAVLPCPAVIRRHDVSYGVYIYAFPVQQLLATAGAHQWNLALFDLVAFVCTLPFAIASWLLIERRVMRRARTSTTPAGVTHAPAAPDPAASTTHAAGDEAGERRGANLDPDPHQPGDATRASRRTRADNR
jgi:peptidoglycan/LPS O-acetylase OafA/YrhL